jgi:hypothetical protein
MQNTFYKHTGKMFIFIFPVFLFLMSSCASDHASIGLNYAMAQRAYEAAKTQGAEYSSCASQDFYQAQLALRNADRYMKSIGYEAVAEEQIKKAKESAEKAEEETVFCEK